jgi:flagellar basal body rod protein FlgC
MNSVSSIALSGLNAAQFRLDAAANNIANAQTPGFRRQLVAAEALPEGGVVTSVQLADALGENLAEDIVQTMLAAYMFKANLRTLQTEASLIGSLLDTQA